MRWNPVKHEIWRRDLTIRQVIHDTGLKAGIVYMTISGHRHNREVQEGIARYLRMDVRELWGEMCWEHHQRQSA